MTNREKLMQFINAMSNKELSENVNITCNTCPASEYCNNAPDEMDCNEVIESWLNEEKKMTNRERYANELLNSIGWRIAINKQTGEPVRCGMISCSNCCLFDKSKDCLGKLAEWLDSEYTEPVKTIKGSELPTDTKVICWDINNERGVNRYFAKVKNGILYAYRYGATSWSHGGCEYTSWKRMELEDGTVVLPE